MSRAKQYAELAEKGLSAREIGEVFGVSRNAVLGCMFRARIAVNRPTPAPKPPKPPKQTIRHCEPVKKIRQPFEKGRWHGWYPIDFRVRVLAQYISNVAAHGQTDNAKRLGYQATARQMGVDHRSIRKWNGNPRLVAMAREMAGQWTIKKVAIADHTKAMGVLCEEAIDCQILNQNLEIARRFEGRTRSFSERIAYGENCNDISATEGISRERVRQIIQPAVKSGLMKPDGKFYKTSNYLFTSKPGRLPKEPRAPFVRSEEFRQAARERMLRLHRDGLIQKRGPKYTPEEAKVRKKAAMRRYYLKRKGIDQARPSAFGLSGYILP